MKGMQAMSWLLIVVFIISSVASESSYTRIRGAGTYRVHESWVNWDTANATCTAEGAHLAIPGQVAEYVAIASLTTYHPYVGIRRQDGQFRTVNGTLLSLLAYVHWAQNEPDQSGDCIFLDTEEKALYDFPCEDVNVFVCEKPQSDYEIHDK
ncbi:mannose-binding protein C [Anabrus simplex]|uniref:mannose-binding protein C n=1 Tax=Anabrus simplex TaxID=316456 RepID=UPI0034DD483F